MDMGQRTKHVSTKWFWMLLCCAIYVFLLAYVVFTDLQQYDKFYVQRYMKPSGKLYVCADTSGSLEVSIFKYAFAFGVAASSNRSVIVNKNAEIAKLFELSSAKVLKNTDVCNTLFKKKLSAACCSYDTSLIRLEDGKHYKFENETGFVSIRYFDRQKAKLIQDLRFKNTTKENVGNIKDLIFTKQLSRPEIYHSVCVYLAQAVNLERTFGHNFKQLTSKFIRIAMDYFKTRLGICIFVVYTDDIAFANDVIANQNVTKLFVTKEIILQPEMRLAFLSSCSHVITTGIADMFGWWVGYLSAGDVVYPVMGNSTDVDSNNWTNEDRYPHGWIGLVL